MCRNKDLLTRENFQAIWIWLHENVDINVLTDEIKQNKHNLFDQSQIDLLTKQYRCTDTSFDCFAKLISHLSIPIKINWVSHSENNVSSKVFNCNEIMYKILDYVDVASVCVLNGTCLRMLGYISCIKSHNKSLTSYITERNISWPGLYHISKSKYFVCQIAHNREEVNINERKIADLYDLPWDNIKHVCIIASDGIGHTYFNSAIMNSINENLCSKAISIVIRGDLNDRK